MNLYEALAPEIREQASYGLAGGANDLSNFFVRKGQYRPGLAIVRCMLGCKIKQETGKLFFHRSREPQVADLAISRVVDVAQRLRNSKCNLTVRTEKLQEWFPRNEIGLDGLLRFGRRLIGLSRDRTRQANHFTGIRYAQNQRLAARGTGEQLHAAITDHESATGLLAFYKKNRTFGICCERRDSVESRKRLWGQIAKEAVLIERTSQAILNDFEAVRRLHGLRGNINTPLFSDATSLTTTRSWTGAILVRYIAGAATKLLRIAHIALACPRAPALLQMHRRFRLLRTG